MHIHITPRHLHMTSSIHAYVVSKLSNLEKIENHILAAHVVLWHDETALPKKAFKVKVHIAIPGPDVHAEEADSDLYACIDEVYEKLEVQLRKQKTRRQDRKRATFRLKKEAPRRTR